MSRDAALAVVLAVFTSGCIGYTGSARSVTPDILKTERGWVAVRGVELLRQRADLDCGPTALAMVVRHYVPSLTASEVTRGFGADRRASAAELRDRARELGLSAFVIEGTVDDLAHELQRQRPVIVGMAKPTTTGAVSHYEVVIGIHPQSQRVLTLDPAVGWRQNSLLEFLKEWTSTGSVLIVVMPRDLPLTSPPPSASAVLRQQARPAARNARRRRYAASVIATGTARSRCRRRARASVGRYGSPVGRAR